MTGGTRHVLVTLDAIGGVWQYAIDLARGLTERGDTVTLALLGPAPTPTQREEAAAIAGASLIDTGLPLDWLCDRAAPVRAAGAAVAALAHERGADVVHLNTPALAAGCHFRQPVVAMSHGCVSTWWQAAYPHTSLPAEFAWHHTLTAQGLAAADRLVAPTQAFARDVAGTYALDRLPEVVHNGRTPLVSGCDTGPVPRALTAGRLWDRVKRADLLDRVAGRLSVPFDAAGPVVGPNGERVVLSHLVALGSLDNAALAARLAQRPVFVAAARFEPFGLAVLEAAQAGCALVLADTASARELWDNAAVFIPVATADEPAAYAHAIAALVREPRLRACLATAAHERAQRFTPAAMADATRAIHAAAIAGAPVHAPRGVPERVAA